MKINNSNERYSNYIAGILVVVLLFIFMGFLIGCWGFSTNEKVGAPSVFPLNSNFNTGNINLEPTAQGPETWELDTVRGCLDVIDAGFYNSTGDLIVNMTSKTGQFPLCIGNTEGYYFNFTVKTKGGYSPTDFDCNYIELMQSKWPELYHKYRLYFTADNWSLIDSNCYDIYRGIIDVDTDHLLQEKVGFNWVDTNCISLESNHPPDDCSATLCKEVDVTLKSAWTGCFFPSQTFCCKRSWYDLDTECGVMEIMPYGIYDPTTFKFKLCYYPEDPVGQIYVYARGGYHPNDNDNILIWQEKSSGQLLQGIYQLSDITWAPYDENNVLHVDILGTYTDECCEDVFVGTISVGTEVILLDELGVQIFPSPPVMKLDSNHPPWCCVGDFDLDKKVQVEFSSEWEGCCQESQEFTYMLVHKNNISGVPNSRNFIAS